MELITDKIKLRMQKDLPGWSAHSTMTSNLSERYLNPSGNAKKAAVLALLIPNDNKELSVVYIKRAAHDKDKHSGQISFPGGKVDNSDSSFWETAVRECEEEIGIKRDDIKYIGALTPLFVFVSNFIVHPFLAYLDSIPDFVAEEAEVAEIIVYPISDLLVQKPKQLDISIRNSVLKDMPSYTLNEHILWGATSMITAELLQIIHESQI